LFMVGAACAVAAKRHASSASAMFFKTSPPFALHYTPVTGISWKPLTNAVDYALLSKDEPHPRNRGAAVTYKKRG
jgi:hypothetical protein